MGLLLSPDLQAQDCISGTVYEDANNNGTQDGGEVELAGVTVNAIGENGDVLSMATDGMGFYEFCGLTGAYVLVLELPGPGFSSTPLTHEADVSGGDVTGVDFGVVNLADLGAIGGQAFLDPNNNGIKDLNEPALVDVMLTLTNPGNPMPTTTFTDGRGRFQFLGLPADSYTLTIAYDQPNTSFPGGVVQVVDLGAGEIINNRRFPLVNDVGFGALIDEVCYDLDADGQNDPETEPGIENIDVVLTTPNGQVNLSSDADGRYGYMGLPAGDYQLSVLYNAEDYLPTTPVDYDVVLGPDEVQPGGPFYFEPRRPMFRCGMTVQTFGGYTAPNKQVISVKDTRDRSAYAPSAIGTYMPAGEIVKTDWTRSEMGAIFGLTIDQNRNHIYATTTKIYDLNIFNNAAPTVMIYRIDAVTGLVSDHVTVNNAGPSIGTTTLINNDLGLGNICYNGIHDKLYATNFEDGTINVINPFGVASPGQVTQIFDPELGAGAAGLDNGVAGLVDETQIIWGIAYHDQEQRIYFAQWDKTNGQSTIWSVGVDGSGNIVGTETLEFVVTPSNYGVKPISDIAFDEGSNRMLLAERSNVTSVVSQGSAHDSRTIMCSGGSGSWTQDYTIFVGTYGYNTAGGVDFMYSSFVPDDDPMECDSFVVSSGDYLRYDPGDYIYGMSITRATGNTVANLNSVIIDADNNITQSNDKTSLGDVEVFNCACPQENCASTNGLELIPNLPAEPGELECCFLLDYSNMGNETIFGVELTLLDGVQFANTIIEGNHFAPNNSLSGMTITPHGFGPMAPNVNSLVEFCLTSITATPQYMVIDYLGEDYQSICTDTLIFECAIPAPCLEVLSDSLVCDTAGYLYTVDLEVPADNSFPDGIGYIEFNLTSPLPAGVTVSPTSFTYGTPLGPGDQTTLMININTSLDLFGDSLCFIITAHDDPEERLCCWALDTCIPFPECPMPCDDTDASVIPHYQGDAAVCCDGPPLEYGWLQDLIGDCTGLTCGAVVRCCTYEGQQVIVVEDDAELCSDPLGTVYDCTGAQIFQFGGIANLNQDLAAQLLGCELIYDCYDPVGTNECCFDLLLTDTFSSDPNLLTAIQTTIITDGVSFSGEETLNALLNGWTITELTPDQDLLWTHSSGITPNGVDDYLFTFCVEGTTSTDSIYVAVNWLAQDSVVCQDTVAVFCPDCMQIVNDSLSCVTDAAGNQTYLYEFSFVNSSAFDVNAVSVSDIGPDIPVNPDTVLNPGVFMLGSFVPPGATYTGTIPVNIANGLDTACMEIVLRQIIGDSINISCCYVEHCIPLPPCDELEQRPCPDPNSVGNANCLAVWEPVCGCDNMTYSNSCYAENAGVIFYSPGECEQVFDPGVLVSLGAQLEQGVGVQLNWMLADNPADYDFFVLIRPWPGGGYDMVAEIPVDGNQQYSFLDMNPMLGNNEYQVLAIASTGMPKPSNVAEVFVQNFQGGTTSLYAYPVPAGEQVFITANRSGDATIELTSLDGRVYHRQDAKFGGEAVPVPTNGVADGVFIVRVRFDDGDTAHQRIVKLE